MTMGTIRYGILDLDQKTKYEDIKDDERLLLRNLKMARGKLWAIDTNPYYKLLRKYNVPHQIYV